METVEQQSQFPEAYSEPINRNVGKRVFGIVNNPAQAEAKNSSAQAEAKSFIARNMRNIIAFAKDSTLTFEPSLQAQTFAFYPKEHKVELPLSWFADEKYAEKELLFADYHELAHFSDMRKNPQAYLDNFDRMEKESKRMADAYCQKNQCPNRQNEMKQYYHGAIRTLYNCLNDIYVNNVVRLRAPVYHNKTGQDRQSVISLYEKEGFADADLTKASLHEQFVFSLLRDEMVGDELGKSQVSPEVEKALHDANGKSVRDLVNMFIHPKAGYLIDPAIRYKCIRECIEKPYFSLLEKDLKQQEQQKDNDDKTTEKDSGQSQSNNNESQDSNQPQSNNADPSSDQSQTDDGDPGASQPQDSSKEQQDSDHGIGEILKKIAGEENDDEIKKMLDSFIEDDRVDKMSPQERSEYIIKKTQEKFDQENDISPETRSAYNEVMLAMRQERREMQRFWNSLIGESTSYKRTLVQERKKGKISVDSFIKHYADVVSGERSGNLRELPIHEKYEVNPITVAKPDTIDVTLLVDCSGSMDGEREDMARKTAILRMESIKDFNAALDAERARNRNSEELSPKLKANSQVILFGSESVEIKHFEKNQTRSQNSAEIIKAAAAINSNMGGTDDASPLMAIANEITREQKGKIQDGKLIKIVFEITDGAPENGYNTMNAVRGLIDDGAIVFAFKVGDESNDEFIQIWNTSQEIPHGVCIGNDIQSLPRQLINKLSITLKGIKL